MNFIAGVAGGNDNHREREAEEKKKVAEQYNVEDLLKANTHWNENITVKRFDAVPLDTAAFTGSHYLLNKNHYPPQMIGLMGHLPSTFPAHRFHAEWVKLVKARMERVHDPSALQKGEQLVQVVMAHHKATISKWIFHIESQGWDSSSYKDWLSSAATFNHPASMQEFDAVAASGRAKRAEYQLHANGIISQIQSCFKKAADESRAHYESWLASEALVQNETNSTVKLQKFRTAQGRSQPASYSEQSPENKKAIDAFIGQLFKGSDGEGVRTEKRNNLGAFEFDRWAREVSIAIMQHAMTASGAPAVAKGIYEFGRYESEKLSGAAAYWIQPENQKLDPFIGDNEEVVIGINPKDELNRGPLIKLYSIASGHIVYFATKTTFFVGKPDFSSINVGGKSLPVFPNYDNWRRPVAYTPPVVEVKAPPPALPANGDVLMYWPLDFDTKWDMDRAYEKRLEALNKWKAKVETILAEKEAKKFSTVQWEPFNETPKDMAECSLVYSARLKEFQEKTKGKDQAKQQEILAWYQAQIARITAEMMAQVEDNLVQARSHAH